jgi:hypothetical protein
MTFRVGQKVVCIRGLEDEVFSAPLVSGSIYTVREIQPAGIGFPANAVGVCVYEIVGLLNEEFQIEYAFVSTRFRPVVSRKTDISALKAILVPGTKIREAA